METLDSIFNFLEISPLILTAGQPTRDQFSLIQRAGCRAVINLALPTSTNAIEDEKELVESLSMTYIHIPVIWEAPTLDNLKAFFEVMDCWQGQKIFVHCAMNMRVSAFLFLYRVLRLKMREEDAQQDLFAIWQPYEFWQQFIDEALQSLR